MSGISLIEGKAFFWWEIFFLVGIIEGMAAYNGFDVSHGESFVAPDCTVVVIIIIINLLIYYYYLIIFGGSVPCFSDSCQCIKCQGPTLKTKGKNLQNKSEYERDRFAKNLETERSINNHKPQIQILLKQ